MKVHNLLSFASCAALVGSLMDRRFKQMNDRKPERKCLLPDCAKTTIHNGGYCCAAHCAKHRSTLHLVNRQSSIVNRKS